MNERHHGVVTAIAVEAVVKLFALIAVGVFRGMGDRQGGIGPMTLDADRCLGNRASWERRCRQSLDRRSSLLSAAAFICLPRMFQVMVVENEDEDHLRTAAWAFPTYLMLMSLFVIPIAAVGLDLMPTGSNPDLFVLSLPLAQGQEGLAILAFLGGFSSATSMVIVAAIALSTMVSNHIVMPIWLHLTGGSAVMSGDVRQVALLARRVSIAGIVMLGYLYFRLLGGGAAVARDHGRHPLRQIARTGATTSLQHVAVAVVVQVDEARGDDQAAALEGLAHLAGRERAHRRNAARSERDITADGRSACAVVQRGAAQQHIRVDRRPGLSCDKAAQPPGDARDQDDDGSATTVFRQHSGTSCGVRSEAATLRRTRDAGGRSSVLAPGRPRCSILSRLRTYIFMPSDAQSVFVVGAGGIGCAIGYALHAGGIDVTFVEADPQKVAWGRAHGVGVDDLPLLPASFVSFEEWRPGANAIVVLCTKCFDNEVVLGRLPASTRVLPVQNGFDRALMERSALEGVASFVSECEPGETRTKITRAGDLHLGGWGRTASSTVPAGFEPLVQALEQHGRFVVVQVDDVLPYKCTKLMYNAAIAPLAAVAGVDNGQLLTLPHARKLFFRMLRENYGVLKKAGVPLGVIGPFHPDTVDKILRMPLIARLMARPFARSLRNTYCSMSGDIPKGQTEIEYFNGHLLELAEGRDAPLNRRAYELVKRMAQERAAPGLHWLDELMAPARAATASAG